MEKNGNVREGILCYGELVVDCFGSVVDGFAPKFGGAPGNTAIGLAKLGQKHISFTGKVGADFFGDFLGSTLESFGVHTENLFRSKEEKTTLAFVALGPRGERDFSFYSGAHDMVKLSEVKRVKFNKINVLQFGSLTQTNPQSMEATDYMIDTARKQNVFVSYDPNIRMALWKSEAPLRKAITRTIPKVDMLKINETELAFLTGTHNAREGAQKLWKKNLQLLLITLGAKGAYWKTPTGDGYVRTLKIKPVDTTGAGDAFNAGMLFKLFSHIADAKLVASNTEVAECVAFANRVASLSTLKKGAIEALPTLEEVERTD